MTRSGKYHGNPLNKYHSWGRGGGGTIQSFIRVFSSPRSNPLPFYIPFLTERGPLSYTFHWQMVLLSCTYFELMQQDGRTEAKRTAKRLCWTNVTGLLLSCFVVIFTLQHSFLAFFLKICLKEGEVWRTFFSNIVILTFVTQGVPSSFLFRSIAHVHWGQSTEAKFKLGH